MARKQVKKTTIDPNRMYQSQDSTYRANTNWAPSTNQGIGKLDNPKRLSGSEMEAFKKSDQNVSKFGMKVKEVRIKKGTNYDPRGGAPFQVDYEKPTKPKPEPKAKTTSSLKSTMVKKETPKQVTAKLPTKPVQKIPTSSKSPELVKKKAPQADQDIRGYKNGKRTAVSKVAEKTTGHQSFRRAKDVAVSKAKTRLGMEGSTEVYKKKPITGKGSVGYAAKKAKKQTKRR